MNKVIGNLKLNEQTFFVLLEPVNFCVEYNRFNFVISNGNLIHNYTLFLIANLMNGFKSWFFLEEESCGLGLNFAFHKSLKLVFRQGKDNEKQIDEQWYEQPAWLPLNNQIYLSSALLQFLIHLEMCKAILQ